MLRSRIGVPATIERVTSSPPLALLLGRRVASSGNPRSPTSHTVLLLSALALSLLLLCPPAPGQVEVSITPTRISLSLTPGELATVRITIINQGPESIDLYPRVLEVFQDRGEPPVLGWSERCPWVKPESEELSLMPNARREFAFQVKPTPDAPHGDYRFALAFVPRQEKPGTIAFTGGLAALLELEVLPRPPAMRSRALPYILVAIGALIVLGLAGLGLGIARRRKKVAPET